MSDGAAAARMATRLNIAPGNLAMLDGFEDSDVQALADLVVETVERQSRELDAGLERALGFIPALLRGRARKLLFPERRRG